MAQDSNCRRRRLLNGRLHRQSAQSDRTQEEIQGSLFQVKGIYQRAPFLVCA